MGHNLILALSLFIYLFRFLVAIVKALRATLEHARNNDDMQFLVCLIDCILSCIQGMIEYLNKWAYIYVGMYGFSYLDAGREVINLFRQKGWDVSTGGSEMTPAVFAC
jgi:Plasma-membrane choline transporter